MANTAAALDLPFDEAIDFLKSKINMPSAYWTDIWQKLNARAFQVAGATKQSLIQDFRDALEAALEQGTTLQDFRKQFAEIVKAHGWQYHGSPGWRSRIIYETNLSMAYAAGRYSQLTEPETLAAFPYWQYVHSGALHPRLDHLNWNGLVLQADDPFWDSHYPPNGWNCGCRVAPVSDGGLQRQGKTGPDMAPPEDLRSWTDPKTGQVHMVPRGIDPGFDYNPGREWLK